MWKVKLNVSRAHTRTRKTQQTTAFAVAHALGSHLTI